MKTTVQIVDLQVKVADTLAVNQCSLSLDEGTIHAIMGPNGSGKSSLAYTLMGHPRYEVIAGDIFFKNQSLKELAPDQRARLGIFLALQHPYEIEGVPYKEFLRSTYNALYDGTDQQMTIKEFNVHLNKQLSLLGVNPEFIERSVNVGFSGGEKKRAEILQLAVLKPSFVILDEIDSGLDIDALKIVCEGIMAVKKNNPSMIILLITHYQRLLNYITPDYVHVMREGRIVQSGGASLALQLESQGYGQLSDS